ncbi:hypothetical protein M3Y99_00521700 [Aphelenchoides fujianensis]|nr:hypothetical protein M3Y99_00521700 [Aphelenchoides fujianensis]
MTSPLDDLAAAAAAFRSIDEPGAKERASVHEISVLFSVPTDPTATWAPLEKAEEFAKEQLEKNGGPDEDDAEAEWTDVLSDLVFACDRGLNRAIAEREAADLRAWLQLFRPLCHSAVALPRVWRRAGNPQNVKRLLERERFAAMPEDLKNVIEAEFGDVFPPTPPAVQLVEFVRGLADDFHSMDLRLLDAAFRALCENTPDDLIFDLSLWMDFLDVEEHVVQSVSKWDKNENKCVCLFYRTLVFVFCHAEDPDQFLEQYVSRKFLIGQYGRPEREMMVKTAYNDYFAKVLREMEWFAEHPESTAEFDFDFRLLCALDPVHTCRTIFSVLVDKKSRPPAIFRAMIDSCAPLLRRIRVVDGDPRKGIVRHLCAARVLTELLVEFATSNDRRLPTLLDITLDLTAEKVEGEHQQKSLIKAIRVMDCIFYFYEQKPEFREAFGRLSPLFDRYLVFQDKKAPVRYFLVYHELTIRPLRAFIDANPPTAVDLPDFVQLLYGRIKYNGPEVLAKLLKELEAPPPRPARKKPAGEPSGKPAEKRPSMSARPRLQRGDLRAADAELRPGAAPADRPRGPPPVPRAPAASPRPKPAIRSPTSAAEFFRQRDPATVPEFVPRSVHFAPQEPQPSLPPPRAARSSSYAKNTRGRGGKKMSAFDSFRTGVGGANDRNFYEW